jgi:hypothetical protein
MWHGTLKNINMIKDSDINFDTIITMDKEGARRMNLQRYIFFGPPGENPNNIGSYGHTRGYADPTKYTGSICDCGKPKP